MKIQLESGQSSSATHSLTRPSTTLNRRYVDRPSNLILEEAARSHSRRDDDSYDTPSRLVNLRLHNSDLASAMPATESKPLLLATDNPQPSTPAIDEAHVDSTRPERRILEATVVPTKGDSPNDIDVNSLALSIAADYTAASLGATVAASEPDSRDTLSAAIREQQVSESVDEIARTASESIAAIRAATDPADVAEQISALEKFAEQIKSDSSLPEITELSETIKKFVQIVSKSTGVQEELNKKKLLSAKANRAADKIAKSSVKVAALQPSKRTVSDSTGRSKTILGHPTKISRPSATIPRSVVKPAPSRSRTAKSPIRRKSASLTDNDLTLQKALDSVADFDDEYTEKPNRHRIHRKGSAKRFALALGCAAACVAAIIYFVGSNVPDISVRVAAMQTGVDASYPAYIPQGYSLDEINSENGKISLTFSNSSSKSFVLTEEKSSWDSTALLRNFVEPTWGNNYTTTHEQGITIFLYGSSAAWVNGGVLYKIDCSGNALTKKQLRNIVTSMQ